MSRILAFLLAALLLFFSACGTGGTPTGEESDRTPDEALTALKKNSIELLEAIADKGTVSGTIKDKDTPCGGIGGNQFSKVKHAYGATGESKGDLESLLEAAETKMNEMGLSVSGPDVIPSGSSLSFEGDGFGGVLVISSDLVLALDAETECLDNPDQ